MRLSLLPLVGMLFLSGLKDCPSPSPQPTPLPTSTPTPAPVPTPTPSPDVCVIPDAGATFLVPRPPAQFSDPLNVALQGLYGGTSGDRTPIKEPREVSLQRVVNALRARGICAGIQEGADEVCILESPGVCQGYHTFTCDPGCTSGVVGWAPGSVRDTWVAPPVAPTPSPVPTPIPCPPMTNLKIQSHKTTPTSSVVDVTPRGPDCPRCASINKSCDNGVCPLGPEGPNPPDNAQRIACETLNGPYTFSLVGTRADGTPYNGPCTEQDACFQQSDNPLSVKVNGHGTITVLAGPLTNLSTSIVVP